MCLLAARPAPDLQAHQVCRLDAFGAASGIAAVRNGISAGFSGGSTGALSAAPSAWALRLSGFAAAPHPPLTRQVKKRFQALLPGESPRVFW